MRVQNEKEFLVALIIDLDKENEELKKDREEWDKYHNEVTNYLTKVILDLDKENQILKKELEKYEN